MPAFVFVNGEQVELLEDRRLALYPRYPEGTVLVDPSVFPPKDIPLSADPEEKKAGFTARKLQPYAHYHAFVTDKTTGERRPANVVQRYLIVQNLHAQATPEFIGKFFEHFNPVEEGDTVKHRTSATHDHTFCRGRGYIEYNSPLAVETYLQNYGRTMEISNNVVFYLDSSDVKPNGCATAPPQYGGLPAPPMPPVSDFNPRPAPMPSPAVHHHHHHHSIQHHHHQHHHHVPLSNVRPVGSRAGPAAVATGSQQGSYIAVPMSVEAAKNSVESGVMWAPQNLQWRINEALDQGPVHIIVLIQAMRSIFGYGVVNSRDSKMNKPSGVSIEWRKSNVFVPDHELKHLGFLPINFAQLGEDCLTLDADVGSRVCDALDKQLAQPRSQMMAPPPPAGGNVTRPPAPRSVASYAGQPVHQGHQHHHHVQHAGLHHNVNRPGNASMYPNQPPPHPAMAVPRSMTMGFSAPPPPMGR